MAATGGPARPESPRGETPSWPFHANEDSGPRVLHTARFSPSSGDPENLSCGRRWFRIPQSVTLGMWGRIPSILMAQGGSRHGAPCSTLPALPHRRKEGRGRANVHGPQRGTRVPVGTGSRHPRPPHFPAAKGGTRFHVLWVPGVCSGVSGFTGWGWWEEKREDGGREGSKRVEGGREGTEQRKVHRKGKNTSETKKAEGRREGGGRRGQDPCSCCVPRGRFILVPPPGPSSSPRVPGSPHPSPVLQSTRPACPRAPREPSAPAPPPASP